MFAELPFLFIAVRLNFSEVETIPEVLRLPLPLHHNARRGDQHLVQADQEIQL